MKLQKVRYEDRLDVVLDVDPLALQALVPTFILQPLLENAIRHGIATRSTPGQIEIQAWCEGDVLHLSVRDDGPGLAANWDLERGAGVGLSNTRERLKRLYGDGQSFRIAGPVGTASRSTCAFRCSAPSVSRRRCPGRPDRRPSSRWRAWPGAGRRPSTSSFFARMPQQRVPPAVADGGGRRRSSTAAP